MKYMDIFSVEAIAGACLSSRTNMFLTIRGRHSQRYHPHAKSSSTQNHHSNLHRTLLSFSELTTPGTFGRWLILNVQLCASKLATVAAVCLVLLASEPLTAQNAQNQYKGSSLPTNQAPGDQESIDAAPYAKLSHEQLDRLVAPIALYPDQLVAQILSASTFPTQIMDAEEFLNSHPGLSVAELGAQVDQQEWDPSVKALVQFPSVVANLSKNLGWTSELGDAYYNQPKDVMNAVQEMRKKAKRAGTLRSTPQLNVEEGSDQIDIEPVDASVVYVPAYDPWVVYGYPIAPWPYWVEVPGIWWSGPGLYFGIGFPIAPFFGFDWGCHWWGVDWHHHGIFFHRAPYYARGPAFFDRRAYYGGRPGFSRMDKYRRSMGDRGSNRGYAPPREGPGPRSGALSGTNHRGFSRMDGYQRSMGDQGSYRGYAPLREGSRLRSGAFSGINYGGISRGFSARGQSSFGGFHGGGFRGGGFQGGFHGGGGGRR
jgi:Protein of unknown function (DUF3300)